MNHGDDTRMEHPDELLTGYVDDSVSPDERLTVEAHLADCSRCRDEVALATSARAALMTLPELEAPGLAAQGLAGLREGRTQGEMALVGAADADEAAAGDELAARRRDKSGDARGARQWRISWALAGAAAVLVILAVVPLVLNRGSGDLTLDSGPAAGGAPAPPELAERYPVVLDLDSNYDQESMRALARRLGEQTRNASGKEDAAMFPYAGASRAAGVAASDLVRCVLQGTGLPPQTIPVYLEVASYHGTPAYVAAVRTEGATRDHLRVYVVSRQDCTFLFLADQPL